MAGSLTRIAAKLRYRFWLARRGYGRPHSRQTWDEQYRNGEWDYLDCLEEADHYSIIGGYIRHFFEQPEILDIGCGHGRLLSLLHPACFKSYIGVDISGEAINRANALNATRTLFVTDDFEKWSPPGLADVIVFNECLYYGHNPPAIVKRYVSALKAGGKIIVSMHEGGNHQVIWRKLDSVLRRIHGVNLHTDRGAQWTVRIFDATGEAPVPL